MEKEKALVLLIVASIFLISSCSTNPIDLSCEDCNVLFLNVDLLRADYVGLTSQERNVTPNIDAFFKNAIIFEDVSAPAGATLRSNTAILTAMEVPLVETSDLKFEFGMTSRMYPSIAETLLENEFFTININEGPRSGKKARLERGFNSYIELEWKTLINTSLAKLQEVLGKVQEPKFILYRPSILHGGTYNYPLDLERITHPNLIYKEQGRNLEISYDIKNLTYEEYQELAHKVYAQQLRYVDQELGKFFEKLSENFLNKTIIVFYANHGDGLYDNNIQQHAVVYQSNIHVPLFIKHPKITKQLRIKKPIFLIDLVPTIYEMLGINIYSPIQGISLIPVIKGKEYQRKYLFGGNGHDEYIRKGEWKFIDFWGRNKQLYNLTEDPHEKINVIRKFPEIARKLEAVLRKKEIEQLEFENQMKSYYNDSYIE